jgi:hypothetical protein
MRLLIAAALLAVPLTPAATSAQATPAPVGTYPPVGEDFTPSIYKGRIIAMTEKTVTVKPYGDIREYLMGPIRPDGTRDIREYVQDNNKPPQTFTFTESLLYWSGTNTAGRVGTPPPDGTHNVGDLRVGDLVFIDCGWRVGGVVYCRDVQIHRRPGGKVPPARGAEKLPVEKRWDTQANAAQFAEEKGPAALRKVGLRLLR